MMYLKKLLISHSVIVLFSKIINLSLGLFQKTEKKREEEENNVIFGISGLNISMGETNVDE